MLELWLIHHGETVWNAERRIQGQQPNPLSDLGVRQARQLGARLAGEAFDTVYCSDLKRAVQTAEPVFPGREFVFDTRLREVARGRLEGQLGAELVGELRDVYAAMQGDLLNVRPPGGENHRDLGERAVAWLDALPKAGKVAAVTHGGVIYALLHHIVSGVQSWRFTASNTGVTKILVTDVQVRLVSVNDTAHLDAKSDLHSH